MAGKIPWTLYREILSRMPICCVDVVIHHQGRALLVRRKDEPAKGDWWLPGGRLRKGEALEKAAVRKSREEVRIPVRVVRRIGVYETVFLRGPVPGIRGGIHSVNVCYLVRPVGNPDVRHDSTISAVRWTGRVERGLDPYVRRVLRDAGVL